MSDSDLTIAIVGATGAVGAIALELLADRAYPAERIIVMASSRSIGKTLPYLETELTVIEAVPDAFEGVDVAFISVGAEVSRALAPEAVKRGALVIDDGSAFLGDLPAQIEGSRFREGGLLVAPHRGAALSELRLEAVEEEIAPRLRDVE